MELERLLPQPFRGGYAAVIRLGSTTLNGFGETVDTLEVSGSDVPTATDQAQQMLEEIDEKIALADKEAITNGALAEQWHGYVSTELALCRNAIEVAITALAREDPNKSLSDEARRRLEAMPRANMLHAARVVAHGLQHPPGVHYRTTREDLRTFRMLADGSDGWFWLDLKVEEAKLLDHAIEKQKQDDEAQAP